MSDDLKAPSYAKAQAGDPLSVAIFGDRWKDFPKRDDDSALARAWPTMSRREKVIGVTASIAVGVIGASIVIALIS